MCGIAGGLYLERNQIDRIIQSLYHRGPNEQAYTQFQNLTLIHTRLSIQDIQFGQQPYHVGHYSIIFNGEIYNHLELRKTHLPKESFDTQSDTETLLRLYIKFKQNAFHLLDGMFAFCILDKKKRQLTLARDRAGKKPLYIYKKDNQLFFASELNTIKTSIPALSINDKAIASYLQCGFFHTEFTPYQDVKTLASGMSYEINLDTLIITKTNYFNIMDFYQKKSNRSFESAVTTCDQILHKSIQNRLISSDLDVGAFLSGGIDSSLIVAIASQYRKKIKTFTVKFNNTYDESSLAKLTANKYKTDHHELSISLNLKHDIEKILLHYGQPFMDSSAIPSFYVSKEAKKHVSVILNGDGADELFGGYRRYIPIANNLNKIAKSLRFLTNTLPMPHNKQSIYNYIYRLLRLSNKTGLDFYLSATSDIFEDEFTFNQNNTCLNQLSEIVTSILNSSLSPLDQLLYLDFKLLLFSDLLIKMDIATMANSLEGRSPFLSKYMLEFAPTLPDNHKVNGTRSKHILRYLSKKYLPKQLVSQPKRGFEVPLKSWVNNELKDPIYDNLRQNSYSSQFINQSFINALLNKTQSISEEKRAKMLWAMYCLEIWKNNQ